MSSNIVFEIVKWIVTPTISIILGFLVGRIKKAKEDADSEKDAYQKENIAIRETCKLSLRKSLRDDYEHYTKLGYVPIDDREDIDAEYKLYHDCFAGNGRGTWYHEEIAKLPIKPKE